MPLSLTFGQGRISRQDYIQTYSEAAVSEMMDYGIPASITLAQGILESGDGNSDLAQRANNHFGIKCRGDWDGPSVKHHDDKRNECFRKYDDVFESYRDHSLFLVNSPRYAFLFDLPNTDYKSWAHGLQKAGYATNPKYASLLIRLIEENQLYQYDHMDLIDENGISTGAPLVVMSHPNKIDYIIVGEGDSWESISAQTDTHIWELMKYNELRYDDELKAGDLLFLQPKRKKAKVKYHEVREGENMYTIAQKYGIQLDELYKKNLMSPGEQPNIGQTLFLKKTKK
jgi:LysM repeat protein